jgi:hypothetical protein
MKVLSIKQPWLVAITHGDKRTENRLYRPPQTVIGQRIGLHASKTMSPFYTWKNSLAHRVYQDCQLTQDDLHLGCIVATALVVGYVRVRFGKSGNVWYDVSHAPKNYQPHNDQWLVNDPRNVGWILEDVQVLEYPFPASGKLGLWDFDYEIDVEDWAV